MRRHADEATSECEVGAYGAVRFRVPIRITAAAQLLVDPASSYLVVRDVDRADEPR